MSDSDAALSILASAAPGQFESTVQSLEALGIKSSAWMKDAKSADNDRTCSSMDDDASISHPITKSLRTALQMYQKKSVGGKANVTSRFALESGDDNNTIIIQTYAEKVDTSNLYTGAWRATWKIKSTPGSNQATISGGVKLHTYSYEEGNLQMRSSKSFDPKIVNGPVTDGTQVGFEVADDGTSPKASDMTEPPSLAQAIVDQICAWDSEILAMLSTMQDRVSDDLRSLRRVLPITKTRMNWSVVAHRNVKTLQVTAKR